MQLSAPSKALTLWLRAALKECIRYGEHGNHTFINEDGQRVCTDCEQEVQGGLL